LLLAFRANQAYGRFWESRGHVGTIVRRMRAIAMLVGIKRSGSALSAQASHHIDRPKPYPAKTSPARPKPNEPRQRPPAGQSAKHQADGLGVRSARSSFDDFASAHSAQECASQRRAEVWLRPLPCARRGM
jgi:hypothetical protein